MTPDGVDLFKLFDLGGTIAVVLLLGFAVMRTVPGLLRERRSDRSEAIKLATMLITQAIDLGSRMANAQEEQAKAIGNLCDRQSQHSESLEATQMAVSMVDQRVQLIGREIGDIKNGIHKLVRKLGAADEAID